MTGMPKHGEHVAERAARVASVTALTLLAAALLLAAPTVAVAGAPALASSSEILASTSPSPAPSPVETSVPLVENRLVVSSKLPAAERQEPPNVRGLTLPVAQSRIQAEWYPGLLPTIELDPAVPDQVAAQDALVVDQVVVRYREDSDDADPTAVIRLTPGSVVPDLTGRTRDEAEGIVEELGLFLKRSGEGRVVTQDPEPGSLAPFGTTVVARLRPPPTNGPTVPSVLGLTEADAKATLERVKLILVVQAASGDGERRVSEQDPAPGTTVGDNREVTVVLTGTTSPPSVPPTNPTVEVPDVTGLEEAAVQRVLATAGLTLTVDGTGDQPGPGVLSARQDPPPGTPAEPGSSVVVAFADVDASPVSWPVWAGGAAVLALLLLGLWSLQLMRRRPPPRRPPPRRPDPSPTPDLTVDPHPDVQPALSVSSTDPSGGVAIRVVPTADAGRLTLEEDLR